MGDAFEDGAGEELVARALTAAAEDVEGSEVVTGTMGGMSVGFTESAASEL